MANQAPFMTKELNKEIMTRLRLRNRFVLDLKKIKKNIMSNENIELNSL